MPNPPPIMLAVVLVSLAVTMVRRAQRGSEGGANTRHVNRGAWTRSSTPPTRVSLVASQQESQREGAAD